MMENLLFKQQVIVSYNQGFLMIASLMLLCLPIIYFIKYKKGANIAIVKDH
jgi:DHA2 family multidrug resistance protein